MSYNGGNVMESKNLQRYEEQGNGSENIIDELIMKTYLNIFSENKKSATGDSRIPSIRQVFLQADYDFDTGCYDVIYQVDKKALTEENIMLLLQRKGCVYRWGAFVCGDAQMEMFDEDEMIGDSEGWYLNAPNK